MNGTDEERHLLNCFTALGWNGIRSPASGTQPQEAPDALVGKDGVVLVGELKSGDPPRNPTASEGSDLGTFASAFGGASVFIARWKGDRTFYIAPTQAVDRTDQANFSIPGDPDRWPWYAALSFSIDRDPDDDDVDGPVYDVDVELKGGRAGVDPRLKAVDDGSRLRDWVQQVAEIQKRGAAVAVYARNGIDAGGDA